MKIVLISIRNIEFYSSGIFDEHVTVVTNRDQFEQLPGYIKRNAGNIFVLKENVNDQTGLNELDSTGLKEIVGNIVSSVGAGNVRLINMQEANQDLVARLRYEFGTPGLIPSEIACFRNKLLMKEMLEKKGVKVPAFMVLDLELNLEEQFVFITETVGHKFVIKPISAASSANVYVVSDNNQFREAYSKIRHHSIIYEAEQFIEGILYQCDFVIYDSSIIFLQCAESSYPNAELQSGKNLGSISLLDNSLEFKQIKDFAKEAMKVLGSYNGSYHLELFITPNGELIFLEIAARPPGGYTIPVYLKKTGINMFDLDLLVSQDRPSLDHAESPKAHSFFMAFPLKDGIVSSINDPHIRSEYIIHWKVVVNDCVSNSRTNQNHAGMMLAWNADYKVLRDDFNYLKNEYVPVHYKH